MTDLFQRVEKSIQNRRLLRHGGKVLVAVSGGLDSMTLLHTLKQLSSRHRWKIFVAHFNHQLRGRSSDADENLVRKTAAAMKLPVAVRRAKVKEFARKSRLSVEMAARKLRHEFFARAARERKIRVIALAHHADDQVELFFLRLLRGAGGEGLAGMKWRSPSPVDKNLLLIRPLLDCGKNELSDFARENKIRFREDTTNASPDILRNRVRNQLLPLLRKNYQPGLKKTVLRLMEITGAESDLAGETARQWLRGGPAAAGDDFEKLPVALQRRVLQMQLVELGVVTDFDRIEQLRESADCFVSVASGVLVSRDGAGGVHLRSPRMVGFNENEKRVTLGRAGRVQFAGACLAWRMGSGKGPARLHGGAGAEYFDAGKVGNEIVLRHWRPGDRFQPIGLKPAVKLQNLFTNKKIPRDRRRDLIVATAGNDEIFWVEGLRISENFKLTPRTNRRLTWLMRR